MLANVARQAQLSRKGGITAIVEEAFGYGTDVVKF